MKKILFSCLVIILFLSGCNDSSVSDSVIKKNSVNYVQAKELIINKGAIMVDVRTKEEYDEDHIDGAVLLPVDEINEDKVNEIVKNKDDIMIVYCKSGARSSEAASILNGLGYHNVYNLGAMSNWKE